MMSSNSLRVDVGEIWDFNNIRCPRKYMDEDALLQSDFGAAAIEGQGRM
jgi:hypothetical protein